ncbi:GAF domain-containing protein [Leptolyngbyaceae cyanobacterium CCMR0082]|uniref:histidine kinase n=1 Tax=Adonisia turfae CCMR0082 TaxID=2304604 RepID=A0A6M0RYT4_9CYAN|nr:ATP-binding protein [Adonisia turfae]NEZ61316.1 GAF domain-containing protein [Adonisia turfae CCMR0082]
MIHTNLTQSSPNLAALKQPSITSLTKIQPHGVVLVLDPNDLTVLQASTNTIDEFALDVRDVIGRPLDEILDPFQVDQFKVGLTEEKLDFINPVKIWVRREGDDYQVFDAVFHRSNDGFLVLELEPALTQENIPFLSFYHLARASINQLESTAELYAFCQVIVREVRKVTGFDRVMLYQFDDDGHGEVVAEEKCEDMEPYLGLHYPESDIPKTARQMFLSNWIRVIPDAAATAVDLYPAKNPVTQQPTDLTHSILRSAYSCHLEYLHNMGVGASLTISLMKDNKLWGLIACHHRTAKYVPYELRKACEFLGRVIFSEIATREEVADHAHRIRIANVQSSLIEAMSQADYFVEGLTGDQASLLELVGASGTAVYFGNRWTLVGATPSENELNYLTQWLGKQLDDDIFYTDALPLIYSDAQRFKHLASGLLAIPISKRSYVLWFRPEVIQTVNWGGDPNNAYAVEESEQGLKLSPRQSFALWKETVRCKSLHWKPIEIKAALELRKAVVNVVLRQAEELALLAQDLERSNAELKKFAYIASHDLQEPLNQVANFVQLLEMRYSEELDQDAKEFINYAVGGVHQMQTLIDDVLLYSKVDIQGIDCALTEVDVALEKALKNLQGRIHETGAVVTYDTMPTLVADGTQLMQLFQNLIGNAIKFRRSEVSPTIHVGVDREEDSWLFSVRDNGIGIDPEFFERIFVIFQRLHTRDEYPGSGMGLAICKKIADCHRGRIWVDSAVGQGATFYFTLPVGGRDRTSGRRTQSYFLDRG